MKPKVLLISLFWLFLLIVLLWGCEHDYFTESSGITAESSSALEQAKTWYAANSQSYNVWLYPATKAQKGILFYSEPSWDYFFETENHRYSAIDVALTDRIGLDFVPKENLDYYRLTGNYNHRRSYTRLVILTDKMNGKKIGFLMTFIPSVEYTERYLNRLNRTTYLQRDELLDGLVLFHNMDGSFSNGWQYTHGEITGNIPELLPSSIKNVPDMGDVRYIPCELMPCSYQVVLTKTNVPDSTLVANPIVPDTTAKVDGPVCTTPADTTQPTTAVGGELPEVTVTTNPDDDPFNNMGGGGGIFIPVVPGSGSGSGSGQGGGGGYIHHGSDNEPAITKYYPKSGDKFAKKNLPQTMTKQVLNTCVTSIMEYIDNKVFNGSRKQGEFDLYYFQTYHRFIYRDGVGMGDIDSFVKHFFYTKKYVSMKDAIDKKHVVMTDIPSLINNSVHNCLVVGYQSDDKFIYMDPEKGEFYIADLSYFKKDYSIVITGRKLK